MELLGCHGVSKTYPGVQALQNVTVAFRSGEVAGVIGENGAGKSTLMKILSGVESPSHGSVTINGREVSLRGVRDAIRHGIAMIHQELNLADDLTVAENIFLGRERWSRGVLDRRGMQTESKEWLRMAGCAAHPADRVGDLPLAQRQLVEIAKALSLEADVLILDEPTAVLSDREKKSLFEVVHRLRSEGKIVILISHLLGELLTHCDRLIVLRDGELVAEVDPAATDERDLAGRMVGRELGDVFPERTPVPTDARRVATLTGPGGSVTIQAGEIVGFAGLIGSGRTEVWEEALGLRSGSARLELEGGIAGFDQYRAAMRAGVVYVSEDRKGAGLHLEQSIVHNVSLPWLARFSRLRINRPLERVATKKWRDRLSIRTSRLDAPVSGLSGGNQQKVSLARQLEGDPLLVVLDEPTRGVDIGAKSQIYRIVAELAAQGRGIVIIGSELPELIGLCHRIVVMRGGSIVGEIAGEEANEHNVMVLAAGAA